jgi:hypothetical protein
MSFPVSVFHTATANVPLKKRTKSVWFYTYYINIMPKEFLVDK